MMAITVPMASTIRTVIMMIITFMVVFTARTMVMIAFMVVFTARTMVMIIFMMTSISTTKYKTIPTIHI
ncbi:hypothetical protein [Priestia megaterium]|uniref:hypothetical protein n=1 Tax=Priestia megaterium TaxID=1404 RepID=UPI001C22F7AE|nr:hypothetical protein [Priestia megaterium]MBU8589378.1 hypothetical protein [Priestia megaterium]MDD9791887.1 hypothetical protein [Priestia megaterium]